MRTHTVKEPTIAAATPVSSTLNVAYVPLSFLHALFRSDPDLDNVDGVFRPEVNGEYGDLQFKKIRPEALDNYKLSFNGHQLEMMIAAYARVDQRTGVAKFASLFDWGSLASGLSGRDVTNYIREIETPTKSGGSRKRRPGKPALNENHRIWIDYYDKGKKRYPCFFDTAPLKLEILRNAETGSIRAVFVDLAFFLRHRINEAGKIQHYRKIPLAMGKTLRAGGIKRVETHHVLFYLYLFTRPVKNAFEIELEPMCRKLGIHHYLRARQRRRAEKVILDCIQALQAARVITDDSGYENGVIRITKNRFYFGVAQS